MGLDKKKEGKVVLDVENDIAYLTISHPRRNIMTAKMQLQLKSKVDQLAEFGSNLHAIVIQGDSNNKAFCAGADLKEVSILADVWERDREFHLEQPMFAFMQNIADQFRKLHPITFAYINGPAYGGGAELTSWADIRIANPAAKVSFAQKSMGLIPSWNGGLYLEEAIQKSYALEMLLTGRVYKTDKLEKFGYINEIQETLDISDYIAPTVELTQCLKKSTDSKQDQLRIATSLFASPNNLLAISEKMKLLKD